MKISVWPFRIFTQDKLVTESVKFKLAQKTFDKFALLKDK
jgi:hypothetical protein